MFRRFFSKRLRKQEIEEEFEAHLAFASQLLEERGLSREEAERHARRSFGNRSRLAEETREAWVWVWLDRLQQDLRYAVRTLLHHRAFTLTAVISIALGIGTATAVYGIADAVLLRPLPYPHPEQLAWVGIRFQKMKLEFLGQPDYVAWRRDSQAFASLAATQPTDETMLLNGEDATEVHVRGVSANFLRTLGVQPALGRDFTVQEELPNGSKGVLLADRFWEQRFARNRKVLGKSIRLDGRLYAVDGVLPRSFVFPSDAKLDLLTTLSISPTVTYHDRGLALWHVYGRLKPSVSIAQARADLERLFDRSNAGMALIFRTNTELVCEPLQRRRIGDARALLWVLAGAVTCLLLIACANVSNLLLARWSARSAEFAVRAAIGAGRARLARQLLTEAALLTFMGCLSGMFLVFGLLRGFIRYAGHELPRLNEVAFDARIFAIGVLVSLLTTVLFGSIPALQAGWLNIQTALRGSGRLGLAGGFSAAKRWLIAAEAALCLTLLSAAALLAQTLWHLRIDRLGFEPEHIFTVSIPFKGTKFEPGDRDALVSELLDFIRRIPGAEFAARTECSPLEGGPGTATFSRSDWPVPEKFDLAKTIHQCGTGAEYAKAAGIRVLAGRFFSDQDFHRPDTLAVINETAARTYFPGESALGKQILGRRRSANSPLRDWKTIVGIVSDSKNVGLNAPPGPQAFVNAFTYPEARRVRLIVRGMGNKEALETAISGKLRSMDSGLMAEYEPVSETIAAMSGGARFNALLVGSFAAIAFFMALTGVYGVLAFAIQQRIHEIGIRVALGGAPGRIFRLLLWEGIGPMLAGMAAGAVILPVTARYLRTMLYGIGATDPLTLAGVAIGLLCAAAAAIAIPALRASRSDPAIALRRE